MPGGADRGVNATVTQRGSGAGGPARRRIGGLLRVIVIGWLLVAGGCSDGDGASVQAVHGLAAGLTRVEAPVGALAATDAGPAVAVVMPGEDGSTGTRLLWFASPNEAPTTHEVPVDDRLFDLSVWWTGDEVVVLGLACPAWAAGDKPPEFGDDRVDDASQQCGSERYHVLSYSPDTETWQRLEGIDLEGRDGVFVTGVAGRSALLVGAGDTSFSLLDIEGRQLVPLPQVPRVPEAEVQLVPCVTDAGEAYAVVAWEGPVPSIVDANGWTSGQRSGPDGGVVVLSAEADWVPVALEGEVGAWNGSAVQCTSRGVVGGRPGEGFIITVAPGVGARSSRLPELPDSPAGPVSLVASAGTRSPVAIEVPLPTSSEDPDAARPTSVWRLGDRGWVEAPASPFGSGSVPLIAGDAILSISPVEAEGVERYRIDGP